MDIRIRKFRPTIRDSTLKLYLNKLKMFQTNNKPIRRPAFNNTENIINKIKEKYPNISTQKSILTAIVVYLKCFTKPNASIINVYKTEMLKTLQQENDETFKQKKTHKQEQNWISINDFIDVINKLQAEAKEVINKETLTNKEYTTLQNYIILRMYYEYPFRNDMATLKVIKDEGEIKEEENYLLTGKDYKIILQNYKTSKSYGRREYTLSDNLKYIIKKLLLHNVCGYLLCNKTDRNIKLSTNNLTLVLQHIFKKYTNKKISTSMLRHIQATDNNINTPSLEEQKENKETTINKFLHNNLQNQLYAKKE